MRVGLPKRMLTLSNAPTQEARSRFEFLLPAGDDQLYRGIDRMCDLLGKIGSSGTDGVRAEEEQARLDRQACRLSPRRAAKRDGSYFRVLESSRVVTTESTFVHGEPDVWSRLTFRLRIECPSLPWPDQEDLLVKAGDILGALTGFVTPSVATEQLLAHSSLGIWNQPLATETLKDVSRGLREAMMRAGVSLPLIHRMYLGGVLTAPRPARDSRLAHYGPRSAVRTWDFRRFGAMLIYWSIRIERRGCLVG